MTEEATKLWKTPQGKKLLQSIQSGKPMSPQDQQHLKQLKLADPPKMQQNKG